MKPLKRLGLLDDIARELQSRMMFNDIDVYLAAWDVDCKRDTPSVNSKFVYARALLVDEPDEKLLNIAEELNIDHGEVRESPFEASDCRYWIAGHFKLFISHVSAIKANVSRLQRQLLHFGISSFVAHEDIEPTADWQEEILKALFSMDALAAVITPDFKNSCWADQEVGIAVGRNVLIVPIRRDADPHGFISKYQALTGAGKSVGEVAEDVFKILAKNDKTRGALSHALVDLFVFAASAADGKKWIGLLDQLDIIPAQELERLSDNASRSKIVSDFSTVKSALNELLVARGLPELTEVPEEIEVQDEVPF